MFACGELQTFDRDEVIITVASEIQKMLDFVGENYTDYQIVELATLLTDTYTEMDVAELKCCFQRIKGGFYGKVYGKLSPIVVTEIFTRFWDEALNTRHTANMKRIKSRQLEPPTEIPEGFTGKIVPIDAVRELRMKREAAAALAEVEKERERKREREEFEAHKQWLQEENKRRNG